MKKIMLNRLKPFFLVVFVCCMAGPSLMAMQENSEAGGGQDATESQNGADNAADEGDSSGVDASALLEAILAQAAGDDGTRKIIIEAAKPAAEPPVFHSASAVATAQVDADRVSQAIEVKARVLQGKAKTISFGVNGSGQIKQVESANVEAWSVRQKGGQRFLDLQLKKDTTELTAKITTEAEHPSLLVELSVLHLTPAKAVGFDSRISLKYAPGILGRITKANGFSPLESAKGSDNLQSATGGELKIRLSRRGAPPAPVELSDISLVGQLHPNGKSVSFKLAGKATVTQENAEIRVLSGRAAVSSASDSEGYQLQLVTDKNGSYYKLSFPKTGDFDVTVDFVAALNSPNANWQGMDFTIATSAVAPLTLEGFETDLEFLRDAQTVVPLSDKGNWIGFLPATGRVNIQWKSARTTGEGKLFFKTSARIEASVGPGMLRQSHLIDYQVLQGQLKSLEISLLGPGEIGNVEGNNIVAWKVEGEGDQRKLKVTLSQPVTGNSSIRISSQSPVGEFPVRVAGLTLKPEGAIRHSGFVRITNSGSVRVEPTGLSGLTQLAPEQFPGDASKARQIFVYRFPSADHAFTIAADRIQPEINVAELVLYKLSESDKTISADVELDIREAAIREWNFSVPGDYSVVSVSGVALADYVQATDVVDGRRNLKIVFAQDVMGRQLVTLQLEKSEAAAAGDWVLPRIEYPTAKAVRGDIGVIGSPGFRVAAGTTDLLVEKPLSYFPKPQPNLQQAFRIREPNWSATMQVELLEQSIQSDIFHLYSLSQGTVYGSALINYFVTGAPTKQWRLTVPKSLGAVKVDGQDIRGFRREDDTLTVDLHQPVMGPFTLLITFEQKPNEADGSFEVGNIVPLDVQGDRGYIQVVSPMQVELTAPSNPNGLLKLDALELPPEFRLLSTAPSLGTWQYTSRPFSLSLKVDWFQPGTTATQIVEFSEATSHVSADGQLVTNVTYYVKSRGQRTLRVQLPEEPVDLWRVAVNGEPTTARKSGDKTLIPLPGGADPNIPIEVELSLAKPAVESQDPELTLPIVFSPVLKTQWSVAGDDNHILVASGGTVEPSAPVLRPTGFDWLMQHGMGSVVSVCLLTLIGSLAVCRTGFLQFCGLIILGIAVFVSGNAAQNSLRGTEQPAPLQLSLPVLASGETVSMQVESIPTWLANISWLGVVAAVAGLILAGSSFAVHNVASKRMARIAGVLLVSAGILMQRDGAPWFFAVIALGILCLLLLPGLRRFGIAFWTTFKNQLAKEEKPKNESEDSPSEGGEAAGVATTVLAFLAMSLFANSVFAQSPTPKPCKSLSQTWELESRQSQLVAKGKATLFGKPGNRFVLLRAPATLTKFEGKGLKLSKLSLPGVGLAYVATIPVPEKVDANTDLDTEKEYTASFDFQVEAVKVTQGVPVLTGMAAVQEIDLTYDESGWDVICPTAVRIESVGDQDDQTHAKILLGAGQATVMLKPQARDVSNEETKFFVEGSNLYVANPGVVDGVHRLNIETSQGQVRKLTARVPDGLTVSSVEGPVSSWQFDADNRELKLEIDAAVQAKFSIVIGTQRGLDPLPAEVTLSPIRVSETEGEGGFLALAFGPDAQSESMQAEKLSEVNLGDFDAGLLSGKQAVIQKVYRYGAEAGQVLLRVAPVAAEVRVATRQVLSLGDERVVLAVNFAAQITRAGLFQLSFPLPAGMEVESLSGDALHHWAELTEEDGERQIILHLNGKTTGTHNFALTLTGNAPSGVAEWTVPRFELREAARQSGSLVVRPIAGIRLSTVSRQDVSEAAPSELGGQGQGALAFNLVQRNWNLVLGIEKLDAWVKGQVLHDVTVREGQTRSTVLADFDVQNASIRSLQVELPITDENEIKTLRASGATISDFIRSSEDSNVWEIQFKRRVMGKLQFQIEYERRGDRIDSSEVLNTLKFPEAREIAYYFSIRAGGRLEIEAGDLPQGWQQADWNNVPQSLRRAGNRNAPALTLRAVAPLTAMSIKATRHSLANALKLRVIEGTLTTVLSPNGDQLTSIDVTMEVIQRGSLVVELPDGGELFSIFVNGESVHSIRQKDNANAWQFYILQGIDDRTANVRFVYSLTGDGLSNMKLSSPQFDVPLENMKWNVIAPKGFEMIDNEGNLELIGEDSRDIYDRMSYLSKVSGKRQVQAQQAAQLLEQANELLQSGEQTKARWALNSVANRYALDAASNEDARVQLENLQTTQAAVGLNTRRQRLYLDNKGSDAIAAENEQMIQAAEANPILQQNELNFRPQQMSQLFGGNTSQDNYVLMEIAGRLVKHQRSTEPAPQAIVISMPEEGRVYSFSRGVQVAKNVPLELDLKFDSEYKLAEWQWLLLAVFVVVLAVSLSMLPRPANDEPGEPEAA